MLTRFGDRWLEQEILAQGALSILIKPFGMGGLARAVSEVFAAGTPFAPRRPATMFPQLCCVAPESSPPASVWLPCLSPGLSYAYRARGGES